MSRVLIERRIEEVTPEEMQKEREELLELVRKKEQFAKECLGEAAVLRELLETCYKAATKASDTGEITSLHKIMTLHHFNVPSEHDVKEWGKSFVYAYTRDAAWLETAKKSLETIKADAERLSVEDGTPNAELKERIIKAAKYGLITHV